MLILLRGEEGILEIHEVIIDAQEVYLVTEYAAFGTLSSYIRANHSKNPLTEVQIKSIMF